jgi:hypothetical protein
MHTILLLARKSGSRPEKLRLVFENSARSDSLPDNYMGMSGSAKAMVH